MSNSGGGLAKISITTIYDHCHKGTLKGVKMHKNALCIVLAKGKFSHPKL